MKHSHLGFVDWGIGGLTVLSEVLKHQPHLQITYFSDAGFTPYGKLSATDLTQRLQKIFGWLEKKGCDGVVVACNAASSALLKTSSLNNSVFPIYNVITPTVRFLNESGYKNIGIIGGDATVQSHIYRDSLPRFSVYEQSAQPLSALIEEGLLSAEDIIPLLKNVFTGFQSKKLDALVLACTHYPAAAQHISGLHAEWTLIDPAVFLAKELAPQLLASDKASQSYYTTGSMEQTITSGKKAFGVSIPEVIALNTDLKTL